MNNVFTAKLLQNLNNKKGNKGFTLIELLVVVIIIGVLAAVALPNLLSQVGKARETEIKNAVGTINRSQQAYHFERQTFADTTAKLGLSLDNQYIDNLNISASSAASATVRPENTQATDDGTRAYAGGIFYATGNYTQIMCASDEPATILAAPTDGSTCGAGTEVK